MDPEPAQPGRLEDASPDLSPDRVKRTVAERGYVAPVPLDATGDVTGREYGVWGPPTAYLVDRKGRLVGRMVGARDWSGAGRARPDSLARRDARALSAAGLY